MYRRSFGCFHLVIGKMCISLDEPEKFFDISLGNGCDIETLRGRFRLRGNARLYSSGAQNAWKGSELAKQ
jgi:hypothetical protein